MANSSTANGDASVKTAIYKIQTALLDGIARESQLHTAAHLLSQSDYADVVTERTIVNLCGYPLCTNRLPERQKKGRYRISLKEHKVYDVQECLIRSRTFAEGLEHDRAIVIDQHNISKILDAFEALSIDDVWNDGEQPMAVVQNIGYHKEQELGAKAEAKPRTTKQGKSSPLVIHE